MPDPIVARPRGRIALAEALAVAVTALGLACWHLQVWRAHLRDAWQLEGDGSFYVMVARSLGHEGSYLHNSHLGWPFGQTMYDLPQGVDNLHLFAIRLLGSVGGSPGAAVNLFFLLTFPAVALVAHLVLRRLGISRYVSALGALLYTFAPYHFIRGEGHLLLLGYQLVPFGVLLALRLFDDDLPMLRPSGTVGRWPLGHIDWRARRTWITALGVAALASTGAYYFAFSMMLVLVAAVVQSISTGRWRPLGSAAALIVVGGLVFGLNVSPTLRYERSHGANTAVAARSPAETELYGLRISQLVTPRQGHRLAKLARLSERSQGKIVALQSEPGQQLGAIGAIGLAIVLGAALLGAVAGARARSWLADGLGRRLGQLGFLTIVCLLVGAVSGFSKIVSAGGLREIRGWNRISIVVAFLAVTAVCLVLDRLVAVLSGHRFVVARPLARIAVAPVMCVAVFGIGWFDQAGQDQPAYAAIHTRATSDAQFFASVRTTLGDGAAVYQMPYNQFPEVPPRLGMGPYDPAVGYIYEPSLNWSWGFVLGRHPDYPFALEQQPTRDWLTSVAAIGFRGLVIDRRGYDSGGEPAREAELTGLLGAPVPSTDGRYVFFDVTAFASSVREQLGDAALAQRRADTLRLNAPSPVPKANV